VAGYHTEYSGIQFGLFYAVELVNAMAVSSIVATLFFGGWWLFGLDRWIPGWLIFIGKMYFFYALLIWARGTLPRLRIDQLMAFAWKFLLPLSLVNVMLGALEVLLWVEYDLSAGLVLPIFSAVNLSLAVVLIVGWMRLMAFPSTDCRLGHGCARHTCRRRARRAAAALTAVKVLSVGRGEVAADKSASWREARWTNRSGSSLLGAPLPPWARR
jgi:hypothetical protein